MISGSIARKHAAKIVRTLALSGRAREATDRLTTNEAETSAATISVLLPVGLPYFLVSVYR